MQLTSGQLPNVPHSSTGAAAPPQPRLSRQHPCSAAPNVLTLPNQRHSSSLLVLQRNRAPCDPETRTPASAVPVLQMAAFCLASGVLRGSPLKHQPSSPRRSHEPCPCLEAAHRPEGGH